MIFLSVLFCGQRLWIDKLDPNGFIYLERHNARDIARLEREGLDASDIVPLVPRPFTDKLSVNIDAPLCLCEDVTITRGRNNVWAFNFMHVHVLSSLPQGMCCTIPTTF